MIILLEIDRWAWVVLLHNTFNQVPGPQEVSSWQHRSAWMSQLSSLGQACTDVLGSAKARAKLEGFPASALSAGPAPATGWETFLLLSVHLARSPNDTNTQNQVQMEGRDPPPTLATLGLCCQQSHLSCCYL